jgi:hypothetical protein
MKTVSLVGIERHDVHYAVAHVLSDLRKQAWRIDFNAAPADRRLIPSADHR